MKNTRELAAIAAVVVIGTVYYLSVGASNSAVAQPMNPELESMINNFEEQAPRQEKETVYIETNVDLLKAAIDQDDLPKITSIIESDEGVLEKRNFIYDAFWQLTYGTDAKENRGKRIGIIHYLITQLKSPYYEVESYVGLLQRCIKEDMFEEVALLLSKGNIREFNKESYGGSAIHFARSNKMLEYLLAQKAGKATDTDRYGDTILHKLVQNISPTFNCKVLPLLKDNIGVQNNNKTSPLWKMHSYGLGTDPEVLSCFYKLLAERKELAKENNTATNTSLISGLLGRSYPLKAIKKAIEQGDDINRQDDQLKVSALHRAADYGQNDVVALLIANGASINAKTKDGETPLMLSAQSGKYGTAELLIKAGADVNIQDENFHSALFFAEKKNNKKMVALLLQHHAKPVEMGKIAQKEAISAYYAAIDSYDVAKVKQIIYAKKVDIDTPAASGKSIIRLLSSTSSVDDHDDKAMGDIVAFLVRQGANIDEEEGFGQHLLASAMERNRIEVINALLDRGVAPTGREVGGSFIYLNDRKSIKKLLKLNPELLYAQGLFDDTIFSSREAKKDFVFFEFLIKLGDPKHKDAQGYTMLHRYLAQAGDEQNALKYVRALQRQGCDINARTNNEASLLMIALDKAASLELIKYIVEAGGDVNAKTTQKWYVAHSASIAKADVLAYLIKKGMNVEVVTYAKEKMPLVKAIEKNNEASLEYFITSKSLNYVDFTGKRALNYAQDKENPKIIAILKKHGAVASTPEEIKKTVAANSTKVRSIKDAIRLHDIPAMEKLYNQEKPTDLLDIAFYVCKKGDLNALKFLESKGLKLDAKDKDDYTILHLAVFRNNIEITEYLLKNGANINAVSSNDRSVFILASNSSIEMFKLLNTTNLIIRDQDKQDFISEALRYKKLALADYCFDKHYPFDIAKYREGDGVSDAIRNGQLEIVIFLLDHGLDINETFEFLYSRNTMLVHAQKFKQKAIVDYLLEHNADINVKGKGNNDDSFIDLVIKSGDIALYKRLTKMGLNINAKGDGVFDQYPLSVALESEHFELAKQMIEDGAKVDVKVNGVSALSYVAAYDKLELVKMIIKRGADPLAYGPRDKRAIDFAKESGAAEVVNYLSQFKS